ncbi:MAG TPA: DNA repair protein RecO [Bacillales bacterium]|nr:DNA repair protein RecO [Bacillales bacterium]
MLTKDEGIVIRTVDYGETNKIVTLFTRAGGKVAVFGRGAKKTRSTLASVTQLFTYGSYLFFLGSGLGTMRQGEMIDSFRRLREDLYRTAYASYIVELLDKVTEDQSPDPFLFELLYQCLHYIDEERDPEVIMFIFQTKMLHVAGIRPELNGCSRCGHRDGPFLFSIVEGGLLCERCQRVDPRAWPVADVVVKLLRLFSSFAMNRLGQISLKPETKKALKTILDNYYEEYSGLRMKSKRFLDQLERMDPGTS